MSALESSFYRLQNELDSLATKIEKFVERVDFAYGASIGLIITLIIFAFVGIGMKVGTNDRLKQHDKKIDSINAALEEANKKNKALETTIQELLEDNKNLNARTMNTEGYLSSTGNYQITPIIRETKLDVETMDFAESYKNLSDENKEKILKFIKKVEDKK